jgi:hypothetical protein
VAPDLGVPDRTRHAPFVGSSDFPLCSSRPHTPSPTPTDGAHLGSPPACCPGSTSGTVQPLGTSWPRRKDLLCLLLPFLAMPLGPETRRSFGAWLLVEWSAALAVWWVARLRLGAVDHVLRQHALGESVVTALLSGGSSCPLPPDL